MKSSWKYIKKSYSKYQKQFRIIGILFLVFISFMALIFWPGQLFKPTKMEKAQAGIFQIRAPNGNKIRDNYQTGFPISGADYWGNPNCGAPGPMESSYIAFWGGKRIQVWDSNGCDFNTDFNKIHDWQPVPLDLIIGGEAYYVHDAIPNFNKIKLKLLVWGKAGNQDRVLIYNLQNGLEATLNFSFPIRSISYFGGANLPDQEFLVWGGNILERVHSANYAQRNQLIYNQPIVDVITSNCNESRQAINACQFEFTRTAVFTGGAGAISTLYVYNRPSEGFTEIFQKAYPQFSSIYFMFPNYLILFNPQINGFMRFDVERVGISNPEGPLVTGGNHNQVPKASGFVNVTDGQVGDGWFVKYGDNVVKAGGGVGKNNGFQIYRQDLLGDPIDSILNRSLVPNAWSYITRDEFYITNGIRVDDERFILYNNFQNSELVTIDNGGATIVQKRINMTFDIGGIMAVGDNRENNFLPADFLVYWQGSPNAPELSPEIQKTDVWNTDGGGAIDFNNPDFTLPDHNENILYATQPWNDVYYGVHYKTNVVHQAIELVFIIDESNTMIRSGGGWAYDPAKLIAAFRSMKSIMSKLDPAIDRVAVVRSAQYSIGGVLHDANNMEQSLTGNFAMVNQKIDDAINYLNAGACGVVMPHDYVQDICMIKNHLSWTNFGEGIILANTHLDLVARVNTRRNILLYTDSQEDLPRYAYDNPNPPGWAGAANAVKKSINQGYQIYILALQGAGSDYDAWYLQQIANNTGGEFEEGNVAAMPTLTDRISNILRGSIMDKLPRAKINPGDPASLQFLSVTFQQPGPPIRCNWNQVTGTFSGAGCAAYDISYDPVQNIFYWHNPNLEGLFIIHIQVANRWVQDVGKFLGGSCPQYYLCNEANFHGIPDFDYTQVEWRKVQAIGDVFVPGIEGYGGYITISPNPGGVTFAGQWVLADYHFRRGSALDWGKVKTTIQTNFNNLTSRARPFVPGSLSNLGASSSGFWLVPGGTAISSINVRGQGTLLVQNGDLIIDGNLQYGTANSSLGIIVMGGNVIIEDSANEVEAAIIAVPDRNGVGGNIITSTSGGSPAQLNVRGLLIAENFDLAPRVDASNALPAVMIIYDGRVIKYTPPGFTSSLRAVWQDISQ